MRRSNRLRAGKCSLPSAAPQQINRTKPPFFFHSCVFDLVEIVDIEDDLTDFPSETTPNPIPTPNPIASPPRIPKSLPRIVQRTPKGRVKKRAWRTPMKKTTNTIPENHVETEPDTQNEALSQPPIDKVSKVENAVENHNSEPEEVGLQAAGQNASQLQQSKRQYERNRRASYKRPSPTGQAIVQGGKGEAPKIFVPRVNPHASSGEEIDSDNDPDYHQYESEELHSPYSSEGAADSENEVWPQGNPNASFGNVHLELRMEFATLKEFQRIVRVFNI
ncbi:hypothetical protein PIB30_063363 [Stylosanthes scabra]|uniref:Uncharacterized protein n=1 Tax=Stylosanthes scabra TaxID=79078 RepID=A0ABU6SM81_9FABA|nr:hypothetical protein [Stylosanthes scabra]